MASKPSSAASIASAFFAPELCKSVENPPTSDDWLHEVKWDGYRILATVVDGVVRLWSRNANEWTGKVPRIASDIAKLKLERAELDGELIAVTAGAADFNALHADRDQAALAYVLFDVPSLDGQDLRGVPLVDRKAALERILGGRSGKKATLLKYSDHVIGHGPEVFEKARKAGLEGIVSKRCDSQYSGTRSGAWLKIKARPTDEFVVVGFTEPKGSRAGMGALLLAEYDGDGQLVYIGRVGTGFSDKQLRELRPKLEKTRVATPTADDSLMERRDRPLAVWVKPKLIAEVFHQGRGGNGLLRQSAFKTFRTDKTPASLRRG